MKAEEKPGQDRGQDFPPAQTAEFPQRPGQGKEKKDNGGQGQPVGGDDQRGGLANLDQDGGKGDGGQADGEKGLGAIRSLRKEVSLGHDEVVKSQQNDGFDVGASCGRPCPGERSSPLSRVSRDNDEVESQSRSERETFYETIISWLVNSMGSGLEYDGREG